MGVKKSFYGFSKAERRKNRRNATISKMGIFSVKRKKFNKGNKLIQ